MNHIEIKRKHKELLARPEWAVVRQQIIDRDKTCVLCGAENFLQVHHRKYFMDEDEFFNPQYLTLLCAQCHNRVAHQLQHHKLAKLKDYSSASAWTFSKQHYNRYIHNRY
jgi:5-methylcytosine-specific restriction endonuclease McrA